MPADPPSADRVPPAATAAIAASLAAIAGRPVPEDDPAAHRAATVIRAIQAHAPGQAPRPEVG